MVCWYAASSWGALARHSGFNRTARTRCFELHLRYMYNMYMYMYMYMYM